MEIIYDVKRGITMAPEFLDAIADELHGYGAQVLVLGCTELCFIEKDCPDYINTLDVLAGASLRSCSE
jgi:aspartate/glutamate racemase